MNDETSLTLRTLKDNSGSYLWNHNSDTIFGKPVHTSEFMPSAAPGRLPVAFGDFSHYWIVNRLPLSVRTGCKGEPWETDRILRDREADFISLEPPRHQPAFVLHQLCKVLQCLRRERFLWHADGQPVLHLLCLTCEAFFFQMFQQLAGRLPVHAVRDAERPGPFQSAFTNLIGQARRFLVAWDCV